MGMLYLCSAKAMKNERVKSEKLNAACIEARCSKVQTPTHQGARWEGPKMQNTKYKIQNTKYKI